MEAARKENIIKIHGRVGDGRGDRSWRVCVELNYGVTNYKTTILKTY
jgi:hypothetical protein